VTRNMLGGVLGYDMLALNGVVGLVFARDWPAPTNGSPICCRLICGELAEI